MAKVAKPKPRPKLSKKAQYERFQQTARDLGVDDEESAQTFERAFAKIVPAKRRSKIIVAPSGYDGAFVVDLGGHPLHERVNRGQRAERLKLVIRRPERALTKLRYSSLKPFRSARAPL